MGENETGYFAFADKGDLLPPSPHPIIEELRAQIRRKGKIVTGEQAAAIVRDGDVVTTSGFVGTGVAEDILIYLEERFKKEGHPLNLTLVYAAGQGDGKTRALNHLGYEGLVGRVIGGHIGLAPMLQKLIREEKILAYNFPQGVVSTLFRNLAARKPGLMSYVGLGTFIDPRIDGGKLNQKTKKQGEDLVKLMEIEGKEILFYKLPPINVAIIRGTTADTNGNITMEKEALTIEVLAQAMAAKNNNGFVIAQVERIADQHTLNPKHVKIPGILVDCVVVARPENHWMTFAEQYNPGLTGEVRIPMASIAALELGERKVIARRAAFELRPNQVVNLGIGMPEGTARVANEEGVLDLLTLTAEPGVIGGMPNGGLNFGTGTNIDALIDQPYQFDFYDGGGLDIAFLGAAEMDKDGNVNVSKFGPRFVGPGGFINISQNAKRIVFMGTFTAGGLKVAVSDGKLKIEQEGRERKFRNQVEQITFSGKYAAQRRQHVLYITERCVFTLTKDGMELTEIAPGVDLEKDILSLMDFKPVMKTPPKLMDARIFRTELMNLKRDMLEIPMEERLIYVPSENTYYVNFENFYVKSSEQIQRIQKHTEKTLKPLGKKVLTIVNYDNFNILPELVEEYAEMVKYVMQFYEKVTRYTTSTFLRMKLGDELQKRDVAPYIYETREEARKALAQPEK
ncbi:MAG TPA: acyl CoA:acetate/3-ketoacid CoA transferase [Desulfatiglandales bacterium]|nr:acyl CoA:acetate/3-ketoacid CoA transferase [Desulfatiglandales bacterium]